MRKKFRTPLVVLVVLMMMATFVFAAAENVDVVVIGDAAVSPNGVTINQGAYYDVTVNVTATAGRIPSSGAAADAWVKLPESITINNDGTISQGTLVQNNFAQATMPQTLVFTIRVNVDAGADPSPPPYSWRVPFVEGINYGKEVELKDDFSAPFIYVTVESTAPTTYTLTMAVDPEDSGTTTPSVGAHDYAAGAEVPIVALAGTDFEFVNWTAPAGAFGNANLAETTFTMPASNVTVTANFESTLSAPEVTLDPADATITYGQNATFTAAASGNPVPTVQWQESTDGGATWDDISGETNPTAINPTLTLTAPTVAMTGNKYKAVFTNSEGSAESAPATLTVNPAPLTVTADDKTVIYGDATPDLTYQITGFVLGELEDDNVVTGAPYLDTDYVAGTPVDDSPVPITVEIGTLSAANYEFTTFVPGEITINRAPLTVAADDKTVTYGDAKPTLTATISGFVPGEDASVVSGEPELNTTYVACTPVDDSPVPITVEIGTLSAANYEFTTFVPGTITINKRPITVKADDQTKIIGADDPELTYEITAGSLAACDQFYGELTRDSGEDVGSYTIRLGNLSIRNISSAVDAIANYDFNFETGTLYIQYDFGGFLPPIDKVPGNLFKLRSTIPVKFQLTDADGEFIDNAVARIMVAKISNGVANGEAVEVEGESSGAANSGNLFRYDYDDDQYIFNLGTRNLSKGTWLIIVYLDDDTMHSVEIGLK